MDEAMAILGYAVVATGAVCLMVVMTAVVVTAIDFALFTVRQWRR